MGKIQKNVVAFTIKMFQSNGKKFYLDKKNIRINVKKKSNLGLMRKYFILLRKKLLASENCSLSNFFLEIYLFCWINVKD